MTPGTQEAMAAFNARQDSSQTFEAFESRMKFIEGVHYLLDIALQEQAQQYELMDEAYDSGVNDFEFKYYVISSDWDEKLAQRGEKYRPTVLIRLKNTRHTQSVYQINPTEEIVIAIPTQDDFKLESETLITDIDLDNSVFVYWRTADGENHSYEIAAEGVRVAANPEEQDTTMSLFEHIDASDFTVLQTANALIARLREDLRNLYLEPHFTVVSGIDGNEVDKP